jgi:hypothetical protein
MIATDKARKKTARTARLSAALRENLKRRKAQVRGRAQAENKREVPSPEAVITEAAPDFRRNRSSD